MHFYDEVKILRRHIVEGLVAQHARIVDHDVDRAEGIDSGLDDVGRTLGIGHRIEVGHRDAARRLDLGHHLVGGGMIAAFAVDRAARIVHHHLGAAAGQQQRMRATEPVARARDEGYAIVETNAHILRPHSFFRITTEATASSMPITPPPFSASATSAPLT